MKWKGFLLSVLCIIGLTAVVSYTFYDHSGPFERLTRGSGQAEDRIAARHKAKSKVEEEIVRVEGSIEPEKETDPSAASKLVKRMLENGSATRQLPQVPIHSEPPKPTPVSDGDFQTTPKASFADLSYEDRDLDEDSEPPPDAPSEATEAEESSLAVSGTEPIAGNLNTVRRSAIAVAMENREPKGICERVSVDQGRVYCWVHVTGGEGKKVIIRWSVNGKKLWETPLAVGSNDWRTWAYITLKPIMVGQAQADILNEEGKLLKTESFDITE